MQVVGAPQIGKRDILMKEHTSKISSKFHENHQPASGSAYTKSYRMLNTPFEKGVFNCNGQEINRASEVDIVTSEKIPSTKAVLIKQMTMAFLFKF